MYEINTAPPPQSHNIEIFWSVWSDLPAYMNSIVFKFFYFHLMPNPNRHHSLFEMDSKFESCNS